VDLAATTPNVRRVPIVLLAVRVRSAHLARNERHVHRADLVASTLKVRYPSREPNADHVPIAVRALSAPVVLKGRVVQRDRAEERVRAVR
jgi:hypothetical protein